MTATGNKTLRNNRRIEERLFTKELLTNVLLRGKVLTCNHLFTDCLHRQLKSGTSGSKLSVKLCETQLESLKQIYLSK